MAQATPTSLNEKEQALLAETQAARLKGLDEDALIELHGRIRRARDKYVGLHRREVAGQVGAKRARGAASAAPRRSASKAELFEAGLARVSASLAKAARASAAALKAERLAAAQAAPRPKSAPAKAGSKVKPAAPRARAKQPAERKAVTGARAAGARKAAKRAAK